MKEKKDTKSRTVVRNIISALKERGINKQALANESGFNITTIQRWENGDNRPLYDHIECLKEAQERLLQED